MVFPKMDMPEPPHSRNDPCTLAVLNFLKLRFERLYGNSQLMSRGEPCMGLPYRSAFRPAIDESRPDDPIQHDGSTFPRLDGAVHESRMVDPVRNTASDEAVNFNRCAVRFDPALPAWGEPVGMMIRTGKKESDTSKCDNPNCPSVRHRQREG